MVAAKGRDFFAILGVSKDADEKALKKAYRKLALKYHPDKATGDEKKFKDIAEAYSVLSDKDKRAVYEVLGEEGLKAGVSAEDAKKYNAGGFSGSFPGGFSGFSTGGGGGGFEMPPEFAENLFSQFFNGGGGMSMGGGGMSMGGDGQQFNFSNGGMRGAKFNGMNPNEDSHYPRKQVQKRPAKQITKSFEIALDDLMEGITKKLKITRKVADPRTGKVDTVEKVVQLPVKKGMKAGAKFTFKGLGNDVDPNAEPDDIVFVMGYKTHDKFVRDNNDLITTVDVPLKQALEGGTVSVHMLNGRQVRVPFGPMSSSSISTNIPDSGLPDPKSGKKGCLQVKFNVQFPTAVSDRKNVISVL